MSFPEPNGPRAQVATFTCYDHDGDVALLLRNVQSWRPEHGCYFLTMQDGTSVALAISSFERITITTKDALDHPGGG